MAVAACSVVAAAHGLCWPQSALAALLASFALWLCAPHRFGPRIRRHLPVRCQVSPLIASWIRALCCVAANA
jgi:hypothetical protein